MSIDFSVRLNTLARIHVCPCTSSDHVILRLFLNHWCLWNRNISSLHRSKFMIVTIVLRCLDTTQAKWSSRCEMMDGLSYQWSFTPALSLSPRIQTENSSYSHTVYLYMKIIHYKQRPKITLFSSLNIYKQMLVWASFRKKLDKISGSSTPAIVWTIQHSVVQKLYNWAGLIVSVHGWWAGCHVSQPL